MERRYIQKVLNYIEDHLKEDRSGVLDNATLARIAGYSEFHFLRVFRKLVRLTPADYIRKRRAEGQPFEYWIGMFTPSGTPIPDGFCCVDFPAMGLGTCWIYGKEKEVHNTSGCKTAVLDAGMSLWQDEAGGVWSFENCLCPRYTTPDEQGNVIMDYCYFVSQQTVDYTEGARWRERSLFEKSSAKTFLSAP